MANTAAHLGGGVLPSSTPVRQYVMSLPFELRALAAFREEVLSAFVRIFFEAIRARHRAWADAAGLVTNGATAAAETGAVTFVQRFGSSVNLNVHLHVVVLDGVFVRGGAPAGRGGALRFHAAPPPTRAELATLVRRVSHRVLGWLSRRGQLDAATTAEGSSCESPWQMPLEACAATALGRGQLEVLRDKGDGDDAPLSLAANVRPVPDEEAAIDRGFNVHASVRIEAEDDLGRERLCRYAARPPLAIDRLRRLPGGKLSYRIKSLRAGRAKHRVMTPLELLARIAAILPPPRYPLTRYHGVLAPNSPWRAEVIPRPPRGLLAAVASSNANACVAAPSPHARHAESRARARAASPSCFTGNSAQARVAAALAAPADAPPPLSPLGPGGSLAGHGADAERTAPNILKLKHIQRLHGGLLLATTPRVPWALLLRRTFETDVSRCISCGGHLRMLVVVDGLARAGAIFARLGLPTDRPAPARARDPTHLFDAHPAHSS